MPRNHLAPLVLAALLAFAAPATAQGGDTTVPADDYAVEEAEGPVSEADIVALCEFTAWMYERLVQSQDPSLGLPADAPDRAVDFWAGTIGALDAETILLIGEMEQIFPAAQANWRAADADGQAAIVENVRNLVVLVWGDQVVPMASYLAGEITYDQFAPSIDVVLAYWQGGYEVGGGGEEPDGGGGGRSFMEEIPDAVSTILGSQIVYN